MVITYEIDNSLYINMTNLCTNQCEFCVRGHGENIYGDLWFDNEPSREAIFKDIISRDLNSYDEIVFCGYGEPTCRLHDMLTICRGIKERTKTPIRLNTNGHASMIMGEDTTPLFEGLIDTVSISLNAPDSEIYMRVCKPNFGEDTFAGILKFTRDIKRYVPNVILSVVRGTIPDSELARCKDVADSLGVPLKIREYL